MNRYIEGNNAVDLGYLNYEEEQNHNQLVKKEPELALNRVELFKVNKLYTFIVFALLVGVLGMSLKYLNVRYQASTLSKQIIVAKKELVDLKSENDQLADSITEQINTEDIYSEAVNRLGMKLPGPGDVHYINNNPVTYTTEYANIDSSSKKDLNLEK